MRTRSVPNSSKQPGCTPPKTVMGSPASSWMTSGATKCRETSTSPDARTFDIPAVVVLTYLMSLNPSAFSSSPTMYWGATQTPRRVIEPQSRRLGRRLRPDPRWSNSSEPGRPRQRQPADELASAPALALVTHGDRSEEHTSELQSHSDLVCRLLLEKKKHSTPNTACP